MASNFEVLGEKKDKAKRVGRNQGDAGSRSSPTCCFADSVN